MAAAGQTSTVYRQLIQTSLAGRNANEFRFRRNHGDTGAIRLVNFGLTGKEPKL